MVVKDIMSSSLVSAALDDDFEYICFLMKSEDIGIVPICDKQNHILGVITDRDLIVRYKESLLAKDLMTPSPITVNAEDEIHKAALVFSKHKIRRLPVLHNERLVGMLSLKDLAKKKIFTAEIGHIIYSICH